jgi:hypothetical protein
MDTLPVFQVKKQKKPVSGMSKNTMTDSGLLIQKDF